MKYYIRFKVLSTGYIDGTIPPQFSDSHIKPIDLLGSDGVCHVDARLNTNSMINYGYERVSKHIRVKSIVGFDIIRANNFRDEGKIIHKERFNEKTL